MLQSKSFWVFLLLVAVAAGLRFHRLGQWSFAGDELYTIMETRSLFGEADIPEKYLQTKDGRIPQEESQYYRLPRMIFVAHLVHWIDYRLFGEDEFGSRVLPALIGSLTVGVVFLLALPLLGFRGALFLSLLILLCPEHVVQSQTNRFYSQTFLLVFVVLLLGAHVALKHRMTAALWLGPSGILMVLTHSLSGVIWVVLLVSLTIALVVAKREGDRAVPWRIVAVVFGWSALLLAIAWFHILPMSVAWNKAAAVWGYGSKYSGLTFAVVCLGWPTMLLAVIGLIYALADVRKPVNAFWTSATICSGLCVLLLPMVIVYNPAYHLLFSLPFFFVAALLVARFDSLPVGDGSRCRLVGLFAIVLCALLNLPSLASHYRDGSRYDYRGAFEYVRAHWQEGDVLVGQHRQFADHYAPELNPKRFLPWKNVPHSLQELIDTRQSGRLWIVLCHNRDGMDPALRHVVTKNTVFETEFRKRRYDFNDFTIEIYLCTPKRSVP